MTIIKLNADMKQINSCEDCPFLQMYEEREYGEFTGNLKLSCYFRDEYVTRNCYEDCMDDFKFNDCPIISISNEDGS